MKIFPILFLFSIVYNSAHAQQQSGTVGMFESHGDVGTNVKPGSATYIPSTQQYIISGAGYNVWGDHDEFQFVWKKMKGDFILYTRAEFLGNWVDYHRKVGWMVRKSLDGNSPHVNAVEHGDGLTSLQYRRTAGAQTEERKMKITKANILQLERKGNTYIMRAAAYGQTYTVDSISGIDLGDDVYVGLFVGSHNSDVLETGVFSNVNISVPAPSTLVPYKQYLGSGLELLEVASGKRETIYTVPNSIQAPNWMPDGKRLLYNSEGAIYTFDLTSKQPQLLNTGDVKNNNNDHVISFDGKMLGLSSGIEKLGGSIVWTVPITGGNPKQITPKGPSYTHGWSPDGKDLVFTGQRNGDFDIYKVPSGGGKEVKMTTAPGLDDGPEYTPDGKYIYFNSVRSGLMQVWRMKADGSDQEQVTKDSLNNWFPHISPDGKLIAFISFLPSEVAVGDHPFYKHVYIRVMPLAGGEPKVLAYVYGGQGTMNTPNWSPDSKHLAFISNSYNASGK